MKKLKSLLFFFILLFPLTIYAQCKECQNQDEDNWKLAAGITLFSNLKYQPQAWLPAPYEINIKYRIKQNHILTATIPLDIKPYDVQKTMDYTPKDIDVVDYYHYLKDNINDGDGVTLQEYTERERKIYGLSVGYNYEYPVFNNFSVFTGVSFSYQYKKSRWTNRLTYIYKDKDRDNDNNVILQGATEEHTDMKQNYFDVKPVLGINYKWKRLLLEGSVGYCYSKTNTTHSNNYNETISGYYILSEYREDIVFKEYNVNPSILTQYFYNISLYYIF